MTYGMDLTKFHKQNDALRAAFRDLRKQGFLAKMNFMCCQNCAGYAMTTAAVEKIEAGTPKEDIKGCVFFHNQDNGNRQRNGKFFIAYGPMSSTEHDVIGLSDEEVGQAAVKALTAHGIKTEWNGSGNERIMVDLECVR